MQFKTIFAAVATFAAVASALPTSSSEANGNGQCSVGTAQCCSQVKQGKSAQDALAGLGLAFNEVLDGALGLDCQQIPVGVLGGAVPIQVSFFSISSFHFSHFFTFADSTTLSLFATPQNICKNTAVCCQGSANNGLIQTSCTPLSVN